MKVKVIFTVILCCLVLYSCEKNVEIELPVVKTDQASEITETSAKLNGNLSRLGTAPITSIGFEYAQDAATLANEDGEQLKLSVSATTVPLDLDYTLTNLTGATEYHFRAYAITENGEAYGEIVSFTTQ